MATSVGQLFEIYASLDEADAKTLASTKPGAMCFTTDTHRIVFNGVAYSVTEVINTLTDGSTNKPLSAAQGKALKALIDALTTTVSGKVNTSDVRDNLTSSDTNKPLSANQGKVLKGQIDSLKSDVNTKLSTVYRIKGTKDDIATVLELTDAKVGDVWNVTAEFTLGGKKYPAGTNVVCLTATSADSHADANWDALGGTVDLSPYATNSALSSHTGNKGNPHGVTKAQVGLSNVTNDAQVKKSEVVQATGTSTTSVMSQKAVTDALGTKANTSSIVDNLTSTATNAPLSANQGKVLKGLVDTAQSTANTAKTNAATAQSTADKAVSALTIK